MSAGPTPPIDGSTTPVARPDVARADLDDETVLYDPVAGRSHVLNASGAAVWSVLDGEATIDVLADEIAEAYGIDRDVVRQQVIDLVTMLSGLGLLEGADAPAAPIDEEACP